MFHIKKDEKSEIKRSVVIIGKGLPKCKEKRKRKLALQGINPFTIILHQFTTRDKIKKQISEQLLETLIIDFNKNISLLSLLQKQKCK